MDELDGQELAKIGFEAAALVPGLGNVEQVEGKVAYFSSFLINGGRDPDQRGISRIRLIQRLRDKLEDRKHRHYPFVTVFDPSEWERRRGD